MDRLTCRFSRFAVLLIARNAGSAFGGAINSVGIVTLSGGVFRNNSAVVAGSGQAQGGAVAEPVQVQVIGTLFDSNFVSASNTGQAGTDVFYFVLSQIFNTHAVFLICHTSHFMRC